MPYEMLPASALTATWPEYVALIGIILSALGFILCLIDTHTDLGLTVLLGVLTIAFIGILKLHATAYTSEGTVKTFCTKEKTSGATSSIKGISYKTPGIKSCIESKKFVAVNSEWLEVVP